MIRPYKRRRLNRSRPVEAYRNLHRGGYSLRQDGLVVAHADAVMLVDAEFVVQRGGHERWRRTGVRNVHAWVRGRVQDSAMGTTAEEADRMPRVVYDLMNGRFASTLSRPSRTVKGAMAVALNQRGAFGAYFRE